MEPNVNGYDGVLHPQNVQSAIGLVVSDRGERSWRLTGRQNLVFFATLNNLSSSEKDNRINEVLNITELQKNADRMFSGYFLRKIMVGSWISNLVSFK